MDKYYRIELPDYAAPSFTSFHKDYFGTANGVQDLSAVPISTVPAVVLFQEHWSAETYTWEHLNIWDCAYSMSCTRVECEHLWLECEGVFYRCVMARFTDLCYDGEPVTQFWGYPGVLVTENKVCHNRLAIIEKCFKNRKEAQADHDAFCLCPDPQFSEFCNDIFGDG